MDASQRTRLTAIFRTHFNQPELVLHDELTADAVPGWDSLNHVSLIILIENEFGVRFTINEMSGMADVGDLIAILSGKLSARRMAA